MLQDFRDEAGGFFMAGESATDLIVRPREVYDGAIPSGNAAAAYNLMRLSDMIHDETLRDAGYSALCAHQRTIEQYPSGYSYALTALTYWLGPSYQIVFAEGHQGDLAALRSVLRKYFIPYKVVAYRPLDAHRLEEAVSLIPSVQSQIPVNDCHSVYICQGQSCRAPVTQAAELEGLITTFLERKVLE
jgi:uncharacterized protein YyaL (SSP411 family)